MPRSTILTSTVSDESLARDTQTQTHDTHRHMTHTDTDKHTQTHARTHARTHTHGLGAKKNLAKSLTTNKKQALNFDIVTRVGEHCSWQEHAALWIRLQLSGVLCQDCRREAARNDAGGAWSHRTYPPFPPDGGIALSASRCSSGDGGNRNDLASLVTVC